MTSPARSLQERLSANLSTLFTQVPMAERPAAAHRAGFAAVEIQYPYEVPPELLASRLAEMALPLVLINAPSGAAGERGLACRAGREAEFRATLEQALAYANATACPRVHVLCGLPEAGEPRNAAFARAAENLAWAVERAAADGIEVVIEALNRHDVSGYLLGSVGEAVRLIEAAAQLSPSAAAPRLLFDIYHASMNREDVPALAKAHRATIGHVQLADAPGRGAPGSGQIDWAAAFAALQEVGYEGWIGCEYKGSGAPGDDFGWIESLGLDP